MKSQEPVGDGIGNDVELCRRPYGGDSSVSYLRQSGPSVASAGAPLPLLRPDARAWEDPESVPWGPSATEQAFLELRAKAGCPAVTCRDAVELLRAQARSRSACGAGQGQEPLVECSSRSSLFPGCRGAPRRPLAIRQGPCRRGTGSRSGLPADAHASVDHAAAAVGGRRRVGKVFRIHERGTG